MGELYVYLFFAECSLFLILNNEFSSISMQLRNPKEVTTEEYNEFYKKTFNEYLEPLASSHFTTEVIKGFQKLYCN